MIFIDRKKVTVPEDLKPGGKAQEERDYAIAWFRALRENKPFPKRPGKRDKDKFEFKAYNSDEIKSKLRELFNGKCAYCESEIMVVTVGDIEHFRPKAEVVESDKTKIIPGYYWLASDWDNLLLSCNNCNRKTTQELAGGEDETVGKGNKFPLAKNSKRCRIESEDVYVLEEPGRLLLNPCIDHPEEHLLFLENGAVQARMLQGQPSERAETSIEVYALHRKPLTDARAKLFKAIQYTIGDIKKIFKNMLRAKNLNDAEWLTELDVDLQEKIKILRDFKDDKSPYAALARQVIEPFLQENDLI